MGLSLSDDQRALAESVRRFLDDRGGIQLARKAADDGGAAAEEVWHEALSMGWAQVAVPAHHGGIGLGLTAASLVLREAGRVLAPVPVLSTVMASTVLTTVAGEAGQARWLGELARGGRRFAVAITEPRRAGGAQTRLERSGGGFVLRGRKVLVVDGPGADVLLVHADGPGGPCFCAVDAGEVAVEPERTLDPVRQYGRVRFDDLALPAERVLRAGAEPARAAVDRARIALASELLGAAEALLETTVEYVSERRQFGVPVGRYQGVSHPLARLKVEQTSARSLVEFAAWCADEYEDRLAEAATMAVIAALDLADHTACRAIQSLGGIGFAWETDPHLYLKRARVAMALFGDASFHRERLASLVLDTGEAPARPI